MPRNVVSESILKDVGHFLRQDAGKTVQRAKTRVKKFSSPVVRYKRAKAYRDRGKQEIAAGNYTRGLSMVNRGSVVMQRHAPEALGTVIGGGVGVMFPAPGSTELGVLTGKTAGRFVTRAARARTRARRLKAGG